MSKIVKLTCGLFEPTTIEVVQASQNPEMIFVMDECAVPASGATLYIKDPNGIVQTYSCDPYVYEGPQEQANAVVFTPARETFLEAGVNMGTLEFEDGDISYSFPLRFFVVRSMAVGRWRHIEPKRILAPSASYTVNGPVSPLADMIVAKVMTGAYQITSGSLRSLPDMATGPVEIAYDQESDPEITITNRGQSAIEIPEIVFTAWTETPISYAPPAEEWDAKELISRTIESTRVAGIATLNRGLSKMTGRFDQRPDADLVLYGRSGGYNTIIKSGIPVDGTWVTDGDAEFSLNLNYNWVVIRAISTTTILDYEQIFARATVYEEAE